MAAKTALLLIVLGVLWLSLSDCQISQDFQDSSTRINVLKSDANAKPASDSLAANHSLLGQNKFSSDLKALLRARLSSEWKKCFGGSGEDFAASFQQMADGGLIVAGSTGSR